MELKAGNASYRQGRRAEGFNVFEGRRRSWKKRSQLKQAPGSVFKSLRSPNATALFPAISSCPTYIIERPCRFSMSRHSRVSEPYCFCVKPDTGVAISSIPIENALTMRRSSGLGMMLPPQCHAFFASGTIEKVFPDRSMR